MFSLISTYTCQSSICYAACCRLTLPPPVINLYRGIRAYALGVGSPAKPVSYYHDFTQWDNAAYTFVVNFLVWNADLLVVRDPKLSLLA